MKTFHVAISANQAWNIYNFRRGLVQHMLSSGIRVSILAPADEYSKKLQIMGCAVYDLPILAQGANPVSDGLLVLKYLRYLRRLKPDLLINYTIKPNIYGSIAAKLAGIRSLAVTTGLGYTFINTSPVARIARLLYKVALRFPVQVWFLNPDDKQAFIHRGLVEPGKAHILDGEGIDVEFFAPRAKAADDSTFRFLLVARMLWDKGIAEYVRAAEMVRKAHPNVVFQLLGGTGVDNPSAVTADQIREWHEAGIIEYLGIATDVRSMISASDCVVLPSYREGIPRTLMEAAAMGKPLIATDVPGCREVVLDRKSGFLCRPQDADDLAEKMLAMIALSDIERRRLGVSSRNYVKARFDERIIIGKYSEFLTGLVGWRPQVGETPQNPEIASQHNILQG